MMFLNRVVYVNHAGVTGKAGSTLQKKSFSHVARWLAFQVPTKPPAIVKEGLAFHGGVLHHTGDYRSILAMVLQAIKAFAHPGARYPPIIYLCQT